MACVLRFSGTDVCGRILLQQIPHRVCKGNALHTDKVVQRAFPPMSRLFQCHRLVLSLILKLSWLRSSYSPVPQRTSSSGRYRFRNSIADICFACRSSSFSKYAITKPHPAAPAPCSPAPTGTRAPKVAVTGCPGKDGPRELQGADDLQRRQAEHMPHRHRETVIGAHRACAEGVHLHHDRLRRADGIGERDLASFRKLCPSRFRGQ